MSLWSPSSYAVGLYGLNQTSFNEGVAFGIMSFDVNSAIRPNGFGVGFYQYRWDIIKIDLLNVV